MDIIELVKRVDAGTARAFVTAARHVIDALLIEAQRVRQAQPPEPRDYSQAELLRAAPAGGWLSHDELQETARRLGEAIALERWVDGLALSLRLLGGLGGVL